MGVVETCGRESAFVLGAQGGSGRSEGLPQPRAFRTAARGRPLGVAVCHVAEERGLEQTVAAAFALWRWRKVRGALGRRRGRGEVTGVWGVPCRGTGVGKLTPDSGHTTEEEALAER